MPSVGEFFISIGFDVDEAKFKAFDDSMIGLRNNMGLAAAAAAGMVYGIDKFISAPIEAAAALENLSDLLGMSVEDINKWEYAANAANPLFSKEAAGESIKNIQSVFAAIASGSSGAPTNSFLAMGLNASDAQKMNAIQFLQYVRKHFQEILEYENKLHAGRGLQFMQQDLQALGVAGGMWQMLKENQADFDKSMAAADSQSKQIEQNKKLLQNINDLSNAWDNFKMKFVGDNAQSMINFLKDMDTHTVNFKQDLDDVVEGMKTLAGLNDVVKVGLMALAGTIAVMVSPLAAGALAIAAIVEGLDYLGRYKREAEGKHSQDHVNQLNELRDYFHGNRSKSLYDIIMQNEAGGGDKVNKFSNPSTSLQGQTSGSAMDEFIAKHQVEIDRINAKAAAFSNNPNISMDNQSGVDRDIKKFEQTNHFDIHTDNFDESTIKILVREMEDSAHSILQSQVGNDPR